MASAYGNVIMLGIPLALAQFGPKAATTVAFIVLVHSPVLFLVAALHSELADGWRASRPQDAAVLEPMGTMRLHRGRAVGSSLVRATRDVSIDLATNPIILAILIGLALRDIRGRAGTGHKRCAFAPWPGNSALRASGDGPGLEHV